jgi:predicted nucleic acid-binding protein
MSSRFPSISLIKLPLVIDASVLINFLGTGTPGKLLHGYGLPVLMAEQAFAEVKRHPITGADATTELSELISDGLLQIVPLGPSAKDAFHELTADDLNGGLDDGEAATIALAIAHSVHAIPLIDDKKAERLFARRWSERRLANSVTLLAQPQVRGMYTADEFADGLFSALRFARMRVPAEARSWVRAIIGDHRAAQCSCLGPLIET